jgi:23S rRNA (cytidine1920-2'-O)/16S rRNA (cytidine1409-2'-O)-methyltransferase
MSASAFDGSAGKGSGSEPTGKGKASRVRADVLLQQRGLAESRTKAQALILAGSVVAGEHRVEKPGQLLDEGIALRLKEQLKYVSRGGLKLEAALDHFSLSPQGRVCADLGASTGGFTDLLLQRGAARVHAVDVGYGQLHPRLRADPRVVVHERVNARRLSQELLGEPCSAAVADLSFISLRLVLPALVSVLRPNDAWICVLVKPQFEAGRKEVGKGGVVRDPAVHLRVVDEIGQEMQTLGIKLHGSIQSPLEGPAGNREFLVAGILSR